VLEAVCRGDSLGPQLSDLAKLLVQLDLVCTVSATVTIVRLKRLVYEVFVVDDENSLMARVVVTSGGIFAVKTTLYGEKEIE
jgi:hypothetical protein